MEHRANGRAYSRRVRRSGDTDRTSGVSRTHASIAPPQRGRARAFPRPRRAGPTAARLSGRHCVICPLIAWALASLLGCAWPAAVPDLLSVEASPAEPNPATKTAVVTSLPAVGAATSQTAGALAPTPTAATPAETTAASPQAPRAERLSAESSRGPRGATQSVASLYLALAEAVRPGVEGPALVSAPTVSPAEEVASLPPDRIRSKAIGLDVEVVPVGWRQVLRDGKMVSMWEVGSYQASWHRTSAMPGQAGNMVITGHNNIEGSVFRRVPDLQTGDEIVVEAGGRPFTYTVESMFVVREKGAAPEQKAWNARWIGSFPDERLTLVTCYPPDGNSHRMIVIAKPAEALKGVIPSAADRGLLRLPPAGE